jgi:hypothetical protein
LSLGPEGGGIASHCFGGGDADADAGVDAEVGVDGAVLFFFLDDDADADDGFFFLPLPPAVGEDTEHVCRPTSGSQLEGGGQHRQAPHEGQSPFFHERWASQGMLVLLLRCMH